MRREHLAGLWVLLCACPKAEGEPEAGPRKVRCAPSTSAPAVAWLEVRGSVAPKPERDANVASQVAGTVASLDVREGEQVTKGQVLARIDRAALGDAALQAEAAQSRAHAERVNAEATLERARGVYSQGISAKQELDDAVSRAAAARAAEAGADSALNQAQRQLGRSLVRSPLEGVVLHVFKRPGELVDGTPSMPLLEIADVAELELVADVPVSELVRARPGQRAEVHLPALGPPALSAVVAAVSPSVDRLTGLGTLRLSLVDAGVLRIPVGAAGAARIEVATRADATFVPATALRNYLGAGAEVVSCEAGSAARVVSVVPGTRAGALLEVRGLDAGVDVVTEGLLGLKDGDKLEVAR
jgi:RND family efflux transporter MFP subunit